MKEKEGLIRKDVYVVFLHCASSNLSSLERFFPPRTLASHAQTELRARKVQWEATFAEEPPWEEEYVEEQDADLPTLGMVECA